MKFPKWSLLLFPILAIVLITMFPVLAIGVAVAVGTWVVIAVQTAAGTKPQDDWRSEKTRFRQLLLLTYRQKRGRRNLVTPTQPSDCANRAGKYKSSTFPRTER